MTMIFKFYACLYIRPVKDPNFARGQEREDVQLSKQEKRKTPPSTPNRFYCSRHVNSHIISEEYH